VGEEVLLNRSSVDEREVPIQRLIDGLKREDFRLKMKFETHALGATFSLDRSLLAITGPSPDVQVWRVEDRILLYPLEKTYCPVFSHDR
jgi:hypothetical protein